MNILDSGSGKCISGTETLNIPSLSFDKTFHHIFIFVLIDWIPHHTVGVKLSKYSQFLDGEYEFFNFF